ncbi:hypothetical protein KC726_04525 [Candidatus Woesebacteria bacterium]|nr:hypothetical protein [Candidatus Woesebacteria bacterium]
MNIIEKYQLPATITVCIVKDKGLYVASLQEYAGCMTEADDMFDLFSNITDMVLTYFNVSRKDALNSNLYYLPKLEQFQKKKKQIQKKNVPLEFYYFHSLNNGNSNLWSKTN